MYNKSSVKKAKSLCILGSAVILTLCFISPALTATRFVPDDDDDDDKVATHFVDDDKVECPSAAFTTIQSAVDAAGRGDIIKVCPGTYVEQVVISKPLTLEGIKRNGKKAAVVQPSNVIQNTTDTLFGDPVAVVILVMDTSDVTIRNIIIDGINNGIGCNQPPLGTDPFLDGIFYRFASGTIDSVVVRNMLSLDACAFAFAIDFESGEHLTVRNSTIHGYDRLGILALGPGNTLEATRNVITGLGPSSAIGQGGIRLARGVKGVIEENIVTNHPTPCELCPFAGIGGIGAFGTEDVRIVGNIVGTSHVGILVGASNGVRVLENRVFDSNVRDGVFVSGDNNIVKDNTITNSNRAGVFVSGANNRIRDNTINEAAIGLLGSTGNKLSDNRFFNTPVVQEVFDAAAPLANSQSALSPDATVSPTLRRRLPR